MPSGRFMSRPRPWWEPAGFFDLYNGADRDITVSSVKAIRDCLDRRHGLVKDVSYS